MKHAPPREIESRRRWLRFWLTVSWLAQRARDVAIIVALLLNVITLSLYVVERNARRDAVNEAVCAIISAVPPGVSHRLDKVRLDFHCGPYIPPEITSDLPSRPGSRPTASATTRPDFPTLRPTRSPLPSDTTSMHSTPNSNRSPVAAASSPVGGRSPSILSPSPSLPATATPLASLLCSLLGGSGFCLR